MINLPALPVQRYWPGKQSQVDSTASTIRKWLILVQLYYLKGHHNRKITMDTVTTQVAFTTLSF